MGGIGVFVGAGSGVGVGAGVYVAGMAGGGEEDAAVEVALVEPHAAKSNIRARRMVGNRSRCIFMIGRRV